MFSNKNVNYITIIINKFFKLYFLGKFIKIFIINIKEYLPILILKLKYAYF